MSQSKEEKIVEEHLTRVQNDMIRKSEDEKLRYILTEGVLINFFETLLNIIPKGYKVINTYQYAQMVRGSHLSIPRNKDQTVIFYVAILERQSL